MLTKDAQDLMINLVAVQLYVSLSDELIYTLFNQRKITGDHLVGLRAQDKGCERQHDIFAREIDFGRHHNFGLYPRAYTEGYKPNSAKIKDQPFNKLMDYDRNVAIKLVEEDMV